MFPIQQTIISLSDVCLIKWMRKNGWHGTTIIIYDTDVVDDDDDGGTGDGITGAFVSFSKITDA
jgi:hypothetical protein